MALTKETMTIKAVTFFASIYEIETASEMKIPSLKLTVRHCK